MTPTLAAAQSGWRRHVPAAVRPYTEWAPLGALFLGVSSGAAYAMIAATLTTRLAQNGIDKRAVTAFTLAFLVYNLKWLWAWVVDGVRLPIIGRLGQRVSWLLFAGALVIAAVINLALVDPQADLLATARAAIFVAIAGATYDIVIDAYRIESLEPRQLGVGAGMSQYGWRIGSVVAGSLALVVAARVSWEAAYIACASLALPAMIVGLVLGEPKRHLPPVHRQGWSRTVETIVAPLAEFIRRKGAFLVLLFVLLHKIGDTLSQLTMRLLLQDLHYTNDEIAVFDVGFGFWAYLIGIFIGGWLYQVIGMKRSVFWSLLLMAVSNLSFAWLAGVGHSNWGLGAAMAFENISSGIGGVTVVAYFSALCDLRYTATQYALISAAASVIGRVLTGTTAGALIEQFGFVQFYVFTTLVALPGLLLFWLMMRAGLIDASIGSVATTPTRDEPGSRMTGIDTERVLCRVVDITEGGTRGFAVGEGEWPLKGLLVRLGETVHGYVNYCPHAGHPLNFLPDRFLTPDGALILCLSHGAMFEKATGYCVTGPCAGESLKRVPLRIESGYVMLDDSADIAALAPKYW